MALNVGDSKSLTATVLPVGAPQAVVWSTTDDTVAKVSASGAVSGLKVGTADITATASNGVKAICKVTVKEAPPPPLTGIKLNKETKLVRVGQQGLSLEVLPVPAEAVLEDPITWKSSDDTRLEVAPDGTFTVKGAGNVDVTAACGKFSAVCAVNIIVKGDDVPVTGVAPDHVTRDVSVATSSIAFGSPVVPEGADDLRVEWKFEDPNGVIAEPFPVNTRDRWNFVKRTSNPVGSTVAGLVKVFAKPLGNPELGFLPCGTLRVNGTKV